MSDSDFGPRGDFGPRAGDAWEDRSGADFASWGDSWGAPGVDPLEALLAEGPTSGSLSDPAAGPVPGSVPGSVPGRPATGLASASSAPDALDGSADPDGQHSDGAAHAQSEKVRRALLAVKFEQAKRGQSWLNGQRGPTKPRMEDVPVEELASAAVSTHLQAWFEMHLDVPGEGLSAVDRADEGLDELSDEG